MDAEKAAQIRALAEMMNVLGINGIAHDFAEMSAPYGQINVRFTDDDGNLNAQSVIFRKGL